MICRRSRSAKGALKTDRLTPLPPISPLHCEPLAPALSQGRPLKSTLTPSCCKTSANGSETMDSLCLGVVLISFVVPTPGF